MHIKYSLIVVTILLAFLVNLLPVKAEAQQEKPIYIAKNNIKYLNYRNGRFEFSIDYPASFIKGDPPTNGDGLAFTSSNGLAELRAYGTNNCLGDTTKSLYNDLLKEINVTIAYKKLSKNWFVVSWVENGYIIYHKSFVGKGSINTFIFSYPKNQANYYNNITTHIEESFIPGDLTIASPGW